VLVYRIPFSTNVERVSLALGHKGLGVEWADLDPADRSEVERLSGQSLVPVLVDDGNVVFDSTEIIRYLEKQVPVPPLWPDDPAGHAELDVFLDWFNRVWKRPPNEIEAERGTPEPDEARIGELGRELTGSLALFEQLLAGRDYLYGEFSVADCAAFPFLKYALIYDETDTEEFHLILREFLALGGRYPCAEAWIRRVGRAPSRVGPSRREAAPRRARPALRRPALAGPPAPPSAKRCSARSACRHRTPARSRGRG
jgi:glutathione S-transferase